MSDMASDMKFEVGDLLVHRSDDDTPSRSVESVELGRYQLRFIDSIVGGVGGWLSQSYVENTYSLYVRPNQNLRSRPEDQPLPTKNNETPIQDRVVVDILQRKEVGIKRYGTTLQPFNGRDSLQDLYEELLDALMYVKQVMVERDDNA